MRLALAFVVLAVLAAPAYADDDPVAFALQFLPVGIVLLVLGLLVYIIYRGLRQARQDKDENQ